MKFEKDEQGRIAILPFYLYVMRTARIDMSELDEDSDGFLQPHSKANNITWIRVECPEQRNEVGCGFYMLRFMKEILLLNQIEIPSKYFDDFKCATYFVKKKKSVLLTQDLSWMNLRRIGVNS
ncbi:uncharacterized protein LOC131652728 isoform X1 [Vicia villosa]|uniref:uncharacterized protein LOC131652728 isoform X1 n=1 Tax=Vicia villosa TaxID=3911 RepID=UPI00273CCA5A|nr:uncharacterized protein LOC131652728 isoform X1 [Vicia villosa]